MKLDPETRAHKPGGLTDELLQTLVLLDSFSIPNLKRLLICLLEDSIHQLRRSRWQERSSSPITFRTTRSTAWVSDASPVARWSKCRSASENSENSSSRPVTSCFCSLHVEVVDCFSSIRVCSDLSRSGECAVVEIGVRLWRCRSFAGIFANECWWARCSARCFRMKVERMFRWKVSSVRRIVGKLFSSFPSTGYKGDAYCSAPNNHQPGSRRRLWGYQLQRVPRNCSTRRFGQL